MIEVKSSRCSVIEPIYLHEFQNFVETFLWCLTVFLKRMLEFHLMLDVWLENEEVKLYDRNAS